MRKGRIGPGRRKGSCETNTHTVRAVTHGHKQFVVGHVFDFKKLYSARTPLLPVGRCLPVPDEMKRAKQTRHPSGERNTAGCRCVRGCRPSSAVCGEQCFFYKIWSEGGTLFLTFTKPRWIHASTRLPRPTIPSYSQSPPVSTRSPKRYIAMKIGYIVLCCAVGARAFIVAPPLRASSSCHTRFNCRLGAFGEKGGGGADEVTVFDAGETGVSWADYKKQKPNEYKVCVWCPCVLETLALPLRSLVAGNRASCPPLPDDRRVGSKIELQSVPILDQIVALPLALSIVVKVKKGCSFVGFIFPNVCLDVHNDLLHRHPHGNRSRRLCCTSLHFTGKHRTCTIRHPPPPMKSWEELYVQYETGMGGTDGGRFIRADRGEFSFEIPQIW